MNEIRFMNRDEAVFGFESRFTVFGHENELASILGWAAERNIPFHEALSTMSYYKKPGEIISDLITFRRNRFSIRDYVLLNSGNWKIQLGFVISDLEKGITLSSALRRRLSRFLSPYYLAAVEKAERENCLAEMLPQLAANSRFTSGVREQFKACVIYPSVQFSTAVTILLGLYILIIPKFQQLFYELLEGRSLPPLLSALSSISGYITDSFVSKLIGLLLLVIVSPVIAMERLDYFRNDLFPVFFIMLQFAFIIIIPFIYFRLFLRIIRAVFRPFANTAMFILIHVPFLGKQLEKIALLELAGGMATLTGAGYDILDAARWNSGTVSRCWMRKKLVKFVESVENGKYWADAWEEMRIGSPVHNWVIRNAASRENPQQGFKMLAEWLNSEICSSNRLFAGFIEVFCIVFNAAFVGITVFAIWQALWMIIYGST